MLKLNVLLAVNISEIDTQALYKGVKTYRRQLISCILRSFGRTDQGHLQSTDYNEKCTQ